MTKAAKAPDLLIVDDDSIVTDLISLRAKSHGFHPLAFSDGETAMSKITELGDSIELVLLDLNMPGWSGMQCLEHLNKTAPDLPVVILSGEDDAKQVVSAMKLGAFDYLTKPFDPDELFTVLRNARRIRRAERENIALRAALESHPSEVEFVARSDEMKRVVEQAEKIAPLDANVLLTGESGVGKGVLARMIHSQSPRANAPFLTVSCPALPRELLESELFGHEKGAFTGAIKKRIGKIEAAAGGTLFLDEIGDLGLDLQPKLLNVLQDREFQRLGGEKILSSDVRIIAATNLDLKERVAAGEFREDLYYRLGVIPIEIPPLRHRTDEIPHLCDKILSDLATRPGFTDTSVSEEAVSCLCSYDFPGNVRQLENALTRAAAFCEDGIIEPSDLPAEMQRQNEPAPNSLDLAGVPLEELEKIAIMQTLQSCNGNKAETARQLGVSERTIYNKLSYYKLI